MSEVERGERQVPDAPRGQYAHPFRNGKAAAGARLTAQAAGI
jgi:hypothetical protein